MKDGQILEILTQFLYLPFKLGYAVPGQFKDCPPELIKILQHSYALIKLIIKEYRPNEIYMSQWIELVMSQAMFNDPLFDVLYFINYLL